MKTYGMIVLCVLFASCSRGPFKVSETFIANKVVEADTLNLGWQVYMNYCMACHGIKGDGNGPAAKGSFPPPRNFKQGLYKFGLVNDGALPTDADFKRIIQKGLHGTAMFAWDISDKQTYAVTQYIKSLAPQVWKSKDSDIGAPMTFTKDPYTLARKDSAIERGKTVYHIEANCQSCHRAYIPKTELSRLNLKVNGEGLTEFDDDMYNVKLQESEYYFYDSEERYAQFAPPDFTFHEVRSAQTVEEIYQRLSAGVTGTGMPGWQGTLEDQDIWAVAYYVRSLMDLRGKPQRSALMKKLK